MRGAFLDERLLPFLVISGTFHFGRGDLFGPAGKCAGLARQKSLALCSSDKSREQKTQSHDYYRFLLKLRSRECWKHEGVTGLNGPNYPPFFAQVGPLIDENVICVSEMVFKWAL